MSGQGGANQPAPNQAQNPVPVQPQNPQPPNVPVNNAVPQQPLPLQPQVPQGANGAVPQNQAPQNPQWGAQPRGGRGAGGPQLRQPGPQVQNAPNNPAPVQPQNLQPQNAPLNNAVPQQPLPQMQQGANGAVPQNQAPQNPQWGAQPRGARGVGPQLGQPGPQVQNAPNNPAPVQPQNLQPPVNNAGVVPQQQPLPQMPQGANVAAPQNQAPQNPVPQWGAQPRGPRGVGGPQLGQPGPQVQNAPNNPAPVQLQNPQPQLAQPVPVQNAPNNPAPVRPQNLPPQLAQPGPQGQIPPNNPAPVQPQNLQPPVNNVGVVPQQQPLPQPQNANLAAPQNAGQGAPVVPQQQPPQQPLPRPPDMTGYNPKDVTQVDIVPLKIRRWSVSSLTALGLNPRSSQDRVLASTVATATRIDESSCQPNVGPHCSAALKQTFNPGQLAQDPAFNGLVGALETFENSSKLLGANYGAGTDRARGTNEIAPLRQAAVAYGASIQNVANPDPTKVAALDEVKRVARAFELRDQLTGYGKPPWDTNTAKQASKAKVELDILSMPAGNRVAQAPPGNVGGVNDKVWIKRTGGSGQQDGSYICKPAADSTVDGIPFGGEAAREGLVQRAGGILSQKLGVDLNIPETHSIALDNSFLPQNLQNPNGGSVACSVQELRPNQGPAAGKSKQALRGVPKGQVHGLIALDICTLNLDRHGGNLLIDANNEIVPIDHGSSLPDPALNGSARGLMRVRDAMPSPHNAMLKFPQAHEPMSDDMRNKVKEINPDAIRDQLATERDAIGGELGQADNQLAGQATLSDAALDTSKRAMEFMKLAAKDYKTLSPAAVQVALGKNATTLLDPGLSGDKFKAAAKRALAEALKNQAVIKEACLMNPVEHKAMKDALEQGGWSLPMQGAPAASILCDPALALKLALSGTACPNPVPVLNQPKMPAPLPGKGAPKAADQQKMEAAYPRLRNQAAVVGLHVDMGEEWAAFQELEKIQSAAPEEIAELATLMIVSTDRNLRLPTIVLRGIQQMRVIKTNLANAEQQGGGPLPAIQPQLLQFKVNAAQQTIGLLRGPLNQQFTQVLNRVLPQGVDAVTSVSDLAFEKVRATFQAEVDQLATANTITAQQAGNMEAGLASGKLADVDALLNAVPGHVRPNAV